VDRIDDVVDNHHADNHDHHDLVAGIRPRRSRDANTLTNDPPDCRGSFV
jgi:hypothetical protein